MEEIQNNTIIYSDAEVKEEKKKLTPFVRNLLISCVLLAITAIILSAWFIFRPDNKKVNHNLFSIEMISELTTINCRYHNVAVYDKEGKVLGVGEQYVWFEYDVIVEAGIDVNEVRIEEPTSKGVVKIFLPPAKILSAKADKSTISKPVYKLGAFTKFTTDDELRIVYEGVEKLRDDVKTQEIINIAYNSAKDLIEQYVVNVGKSVGENYTVDWIEVSNEIPAATAKQASSATE
ncbi:MAG: DUF4230 domain-containing protein [Clostridia bacterium]|nr:DUF4230 domain-containing protein [Clostridia bacterium]